MRLPTARICLLVGLGLLHATASANYQVKINSTSDLSNVFIYADEWNGSVYAWTLFPSAVGAVTAGVERTFDLGTPNIACWALIANSGNGAATGINDSIPPVDGKSFSQVFPGYTEASTSANISGLYDGVAYNSSVAFTLFDFVLTNEDTLKTDFPAGSLHIYGFNGNPAANLGTATFTSAVPEPATLAALSLGALALLRRRHRHC